MDSIVRYLDSNSEHQRSNNKDHDLMSMDGDQSPLIETDEIFPTDDAMSLVSEKVIGADDSMLSMRPC